jgi:hypothetical protein
MTFKIISDEVNRQPIDDFLGLTADHVHDILYSPLDEIQHIVNINTSFDPNLLKKVGVVAKVNLLIKLIGDAGGAKATQKGYLPKKIVNALNEFHGLGNFTVGSEEDAPDVLTLRQAVTKCGWIKKSSGRFLLTKKGEEIYRDGFSQSHYVVLLRFWMFSYNWGDTDGHPACPIIQESAVFSLYMLMKRAQEPLSSGDFTGLFIRAFPYALQLLSAEPSRIEISLHRAISPEERLGSVLRLRFLQRFAAYFGLIDYLVDEKLPYFERYQKAQFKTSRLFNEVFSWFAPDQQRSAAAVPGIGNDLSH